MARASIRLSHIVRSVWRVVPRASATAANEPVSFTAASAWQPITTDTSLPSQMGLPVGGGVSYVGGGMTDFAGVSAAGINPLMLLAMGGLLLVAIKRKGKR